MRLKYFDFQSVKVCELFTMLSDCFGKLIHNFIYNNYLSGSLIFKRLIYLDFYFINIQKEEYRDCQQSCIDYLGASGVF